MKILAVTTFNAEGRDLYGDRMVESFKANWPIPLRVYSEGWHGYDLMKASPWLGAFKERHKARRFRDYRWDAVRFAHKVAAVCHAARGSADYLIWIDGDTYTHSPVSNEDIAGLLPRGEWIAWLDRARMYPECGFFVLNCRHPRHAEMIDALESMYTEDRLFGLPEHHDSYILGHLVKSERIGAKSLSGEGFNTTHPAANGPLSRWIDHMKGPRKKRGRTPPRERLVKDGVGYWR